MKNWILYLFLLLMFPILAKADYASNVRIQQRNKDIIITYDLSKTSNVQIFIASDKAKTFTLLQAVDGAVGANVRAGKDLKAIWHPLEEQESFIAGNVRFKVEALGSYEQYILPKSQKGVSQGGKTNMETVLMVNFAYAPAPQMSYGLTFGQTYSGLGWLINARTDFHLQSAGNGLSCEEGGYINGILPFYSGQTKSSLLVINANFWLDILELAGCSSRNRFNTFGIYTGLGYGVRRVLWETLDNQWIEYGPTSANGLSMNIGLIGSIYGLTLKAGVNTINFKYSEIEVGIGWMF